MSEKGHEAVFVISPAGMLAGATAARTPASSLLVNAMINEAMAARDLLRVDKAAGAIQAVGRPEELLRYVECRERTERAMRACGLNIEQARWHRTWAAGEDVDV